MLCDYSKKDIARNLDTLIQLVNDPVFICTKCARVANVDKVLCYSQKL